MYFAIKLIQYLKKQGISTMKFLSVFLSFVLVFHWSVYQAFAQRHHEWFGFDREHVTEVIHHALDSKVELKGYWLDPDQTRISEMSTIEIEDEISRVKNRLESLLQRDPEMKKLGIAAGTVLMLLIGTLVAGYTRTSLLKVYLSMIVGVGALSAFYAYYRLYTASFNQGATGRFYYGLLNKNERALEIGSCLIFITQTGYFEIINCPDHPDILPSTETPLAINIEALRGKPYIVTSGTFF